MHFAHPHFLWLLLLLIPLTAWYILKQRNAHATMSLSTTAAFNAMPRSWKQYLRYALFALRLAAIACVIVVLARPQVRDSWRTTSTEGTDIVLALDVSSSMLARDFDPDRFEAAGMACVGENPDAQLVEVVEMPSKRWYIGTQYHPEYSSTVLSPSPIFASFIEAAIDYHDEKATK